MSKYDKAKNFAIVALENALEAHARNDLLSIENGLEEFEGLVSESEVISNSLLYLSLEFWSGWSDSAVHDWRFYEPLQEDDWPRLAVILLNDLKANREITNSDILLYFRVKPKNSKVSLLTKLWSLVRGNAI